MMTLLNGTTTPPAVVIFTCVRSSSKGVWVDLLLGNMSVDKIM